MFDLAYKIKEDAELLVLDIGKAKPHSELHERALKILMSSIELENELKNNSNSKTNTIRQNKQQNKGQARYRTVSQEKDRVKKKLKRWVEHPNQYNYKILKKYLELKNSHVTKITEEILGDALIKDGSITKINTFYTNFSQMKTDAKKSHGKIFEIIDGAIEIWEPVLEYVNDFEHDDCKRNR